MRRILFPQLLAGVIASLAVAGFDSVSAALSLAYGVVVMAVNGLVLARDAGCDENAEKRLRLRLYKGAVLRFLGVIAALLLAHYLGLMLLYVAAGMFVAQCVVFFAGMRLLVSDR